MNINKMLEYVASGLSILQHVLLHWTESTRHSFHCWKRFLTVGHACQFHELVSRDTNFGRVEGSVVHSQAEALRDKGKVTVKEALVICMVSLPCIENGRQVVCTPKLFMTV